MNLRNGAARLAGRSARTAGAVLVAVAVAVVLVTASGAAAQTSGGTQNASGTSSSVGGIVFLGVSAVIAGTALILYLRHRTPRSRRGAGEASAPEPGPAGPTGP